MHLEAHLTAKDFSHVLAQLTPLRIALDGDGERRFLSLSRPTHVAFAGLSGLRVIADLQLQWDVIGVLLPVSLKRVSVLLSPSVVEVEGQSVLAFGVRIEDADLSAIPSFVESMLLDRVNDALAKRESSFAWRFMETLDFTFRLPAQVSPRYRVRLYASSGEASMNAHALVLRVDWGLEAHPHDAQHEQFADDDGVS